MKTLAIIGKTLSEIGNTPTHMITLCAAISLQGVLHHHATLGPYNTAHNQKNKIKNYFLKPYYFCIHWNVQ